MSPKRETAPPMYATRGDAIAMSYASRIAWAVSRIGYSTIEPGGTSRMTSMLVTSASAACTSAGALDLRARGCRRGGALMHGVEVLERLARRPAAAPARRCSGVAPRRRAASAEEVGARAPARLHPLGLRERRARLLEIDHDRVGAGRDARARCRRGRARRRRAPCAAGGPCAASCGARHGDVVAGERRGHRRLTDRAREEVRVGRPRAGGPG